MASVIIRPEKEQDFKTNFEVKRLGWLSAYSNIFSADAINEHFRKKQNDPEYLSNYLNLVKNSKQLYVAEINGKVVATMNIAQKLPNDDFVEILWLYVHPDYQRMGIGKKLYEFAKTIALSQNVTKIHIEALKDNQIGCAFYTKTGGKIISRRIKHMLGIEPELVTFEFNLEPIILETDRLILRKYNETDIDDYFEYIKREDVGPRIGFKPYTSKQDALERLKYETTKSFHFGIVLKKQNKVIGSIELMNCKTERYSNLKIEDGAKEIGFMLSPSFWGLGIMPEACKAILKFAFENLYVPAVYIGHAESNPQSARVQDKLGFKVIGKLENYRTWIDGNITSLVERKMTIEEWINKNTH